MPLEARTPFFYGVSAPDYNHRVRELLIRFCSIPRSTVASVQLEGETREVCEAVLSTISWDPDRIHSFASGYATEVQSYTLKAIQFLGDKALLAKACPIGFASSENYRVLDTAAKAFGSHWLKSRYTYFLRALIFVCMLINVVAWVSRWQHCLIF